MCAWEDGANGTLKHCINPHQYNWHQRRQFLHLDRRWERGWDEKWKRLKVFYLHLFYAIFSSRFECEMFQVPFFPLLNDFLFDFSPTNAHQSMCQCVCGGSAVVGVSWSILCWNSLCICGLHNCSLLHDVIQSDIAVSIQMRNAHWNMKHFILSECEWLETLFDA